MTAWYVPPTMRAYRLSWLGPDALAGLTLLAVAVPSQMATARLANLPPVDGLYAFLAGSLLYAVLGTNSHLSVGADSTIAPVLAMGAASVAAVGTSQYATVMAFAALLVGTLLVLVGLLRLGWIGEFLSTPVVTGVLAGIAVEIVVRQLPTILGVTGGGTTTIARLRRVIAELGHANGWSLGIAVGVLGVIVGAELIDRRLPGALLALVLSIVAVEVFGLTRSHGVAVIGAVSGGLPRVVLPSVSWSQLHRLIGPVVTVAFVCVAQTAATLRGSEPGSPASDHSNRDLIAVGAGSLGAGLLGTLAVDASPPNTAIVKASGSRSQLTNVLAAVGVAVVLLVATAPLAHVPQATLGATLVFISAKLFRLGELRAVLHFDRSEFALATAALLVVGLVGIEQGVVFAVIVSLADRTRRSARPQDAILGREPGTDHWIPTDVGQRTEQIPGTLVYLLYAPLWYANADHVALRVRHLVASATDPVSVLIIDADGISDIDYTGLQALRDLTIELDRAGTKIGFARASHLVHHDLKHGALLQHLGPDHVFASVAEAVRALSG